MTECDPAPKCGDCARHNLITLNVLGTSLKAAFQMCGYHVRDNSQFVLCADERAEGACGVEGKHFQKRAENENAIAPQA